MPSLVLPNGVPLGLWWYVTWISVQAILYAIFQGLAVPHSQSSEKANEATKRRLFQLNEYLFNIYSNFVSNPSTDGPIESIDDLSRLLDRARNTYLPIHQYNLLQKETALGKLSCYIGVVVALILGVLYYLKYPSIAIISLISFIGVGIWGIWALWHIIFSIKYYILTIRLSHEND